MKTEFAASLKAARVKAGFRTCRSAAAQIGMPDSQYWRIESGDNEPKWRTAYTLIVGLGLDLGRFFPEDLILSAAARIGERRAALQQTASINGSVSGKE